MTARIERTVDRSCALPASQTRGVSHLSPSDSRGRVGTRSVTRSSQPSEPDRPPGGDTPRAVHITSKGGAVFNPVELSVEWNGLPCQARSGSKGWVSGCRYRHPHTLSAAFVARIGFRPTPRVCDADIYGSWYERSRTTMVRARRPRMAGTQDIARVEVSRLSLARTWSGRMGARAVRRWPWRRLCLGLGRRETGVGARPQPSRCSMPCLETLASVISPGIQSGLSSGAVFFQAHPS